MTREGWKDALEYAIEKAAHGDSEMIDLFAKLLEEQDAAKAALQNKGYGCCGIPWPELVEEVPSREGWE